MTQGKERVAFEIQTFVFFKDLLGLVVRQVVSISRYVAADTDFKAGTDVWVEISLYGVEDMDVRMCFCRRDVRIGGAV